MGRIAAIYRYPVKGLSAEKLARAPLAVGRCLPYDRSFAVALPATRFDPTQPEWLAKRNFVMLMRDEKLAELTTRFAEASAELTVEHQGAVALRARLGEEEGRRALAEFLGDFLAPAVTGPLRVVTAPGHTFADARRKEGATSDQYVSLINLASIGALETAIGAAVDPLRFRANVYFSGETAWQELDWLGHEVAVGGARLRVVSAITRCAATEVNPETAERDLDIVAALERHFGHNLMGVYGEVIAGGDIAVGDALTAAPGD
jgi:uncharacterized protein YcbX